MSNKAKDDIEKKQAYFGSAECLYRLRRWNEAAVSFINFAVEFTNSPSRHSALYYAAKSLENAGLSSNAVTIYKNLIADYPGSSYYLEAVQRVTELQTGWMEKSFSITTNIITNVNLNTDLLSNITASNISGSNDISTPSMKKDIIKEQEKTNTGEGYSDDKKKEEELERFRALIELKAKLLEIKEKAIKEKKDLLYNTNN